MILGCYRTGDANDPEVYVRAVTAVLGAYPMDVVRAVCDPRSGIPSKSKWLPTVAEIKEACEEEMAPIYRRQHDDRLAKERRQRELEDNRPRPSIEELRAKHGDNWGIDAENGPRKSAEFTLDDMCRQAGISREEFEVINARAAEGQRRWDESR